MHHRLLAAIPLLALALPAQQDRLELRLLGLIQELDGGPRHQQALEELGRHTRQALPLLAVHLADHESPLLGGALDAITEMGPQAVPVIPFLIDLLETRPSHPLWRQILDAVSAIGPYARGSRLDLILALSHFRDIHDSSPREFIRAFSRLQVDTAASLEELIDGLAADNPYERELSAELLAAYGRDAEFAVPDLLDTLAQHHLGDVRLGGQDWQAAVCGHFDYLVHSQAAIALIAIAPDASDIFPAYIYQLRSGDPRQRRESALALGRFSEDTVDIILALEQALGDEDVRVVREAITSLGMLGTQASEMRHALEDLLEDEDREIQRRAAAALSRIRRAR